MQRHYWVRSLIALWSLWFTAAVTEPAGLFVCAMHSGTAGGYGAAHGGHAMASMSAAAHGLHRTSPADAAHPRTAQSVANDEATAGIPSPSQGGGCTCLGECCAVTPASLPVRSVDFALGISSESSVVPAAPSVEPVARQPYLLPFANGPPRRV